MPSLGRQTWFGFVLIICVVVYELYCPEEDEAQVVAWLGRVWNDKPASSTDQFTRIAVG